MSEWKESTSYVRPTIRNGRTWWWVVYSGNNEGGSDECVCVCVSCRAAVISCINKQKPYSFFLLSVLDASRELELKKRIVPFHSHSGPSPLYRPIYPTNRVRIHSEHIVYRRKLKLQQKSRVKMVYLVCDSCTQFCRHSGVVSTQKQRRAGRFYVSATTAIVVVAAATVVVKIDVWFAAHSKYGCDTCWAPYSGISKPANQIEIWEIKSAHRK